MTMTKEPRYSSYESDVYDKNKLIFECRNAAIAEELVDALNAKNRRDKMYQRAKTNSPDLLYVVSRYDTDPLLDGAPHYVPDGETSPSFHYIVRSIHDGWPDQWSVRLPDRGCNYAAKRKLENLAVIMTAFEKSTDSFWSDRI